MNLHAFKRQAHTSVEISVHLALGRRVRIVGEGAKADRLFDFSESIFIDDGAGATMIPALFFPTDGTNCRRVTSADPRFEYPG